MKVRYTPEALNDLQEMSDYISNVLYNPQAAARIKKSILDSCGRLKEQPFLGPSVQVKTGCKTDLRFLVCEKHLAFYRVENGYISVARIINGRQDYLRILFGDIGE
ncbi:Plasmid stabilization system protein [Pelotomaculum schinkii]|uniref:Plasmid stabilization system protein n=1 Tax=Pelotomaculum schinkii TaxID=78350 RepID=A0A4Y7RHK8_9FIRM|nr:MULTISPECIES: type II toxin-antitoxin system RelE/ParE family toxin [Pelotomaculum]TEB08172.1 Plasmid stabilization system protein [Pelotomaculum schinkii]TEB15118.1 Plasmid stabilization system protein [Pelotomaculum sp. FP]